MKLYPRYLVAFMVLIAFNSPVRLSAGIVPQFVSNRVSTFLVREEIASLTPEQQQEGWILDQLDRRIVELKKKDTVEEITVDPQRCWDLLVPEPSTACIGALDYRLKECNETTNVSDWHNKLDKLQSLIKPIKHPDSQIMYTLLEQAKKNPLKKFLRIKYVAPVLTAIAVLGYMGMKKLGITIPYFGETDSKENMPFVYKKPIRDEQFIKDLAEGKVTVETLPAKFVLVRNNFTPENLQKLVELKTPFIGAVFKTLHETPDKLDVTVNGQPIIENAIPKANEQKIEIPAGQKSVPVEIHYSFEWNAPEKLKKWDAYGLTGAIKLALQQCGIPKALLDKPVRGTKVVVYDIGRENNSVDISFAGWAEKQERAKRMTDQCPGVPDIYPRNDLFQINAVQKIGERVIGTPEPVDLFTN